LEVEEEQEWKEILEQLQLTSPHIFHAFVNVSAYRQRLLDHLAVDLLTANVPLLSCFMS